jgi:hypothetical protein
LLELLPEEGRKTRQPAGANARRALQGRGAL